MRIFEVCSGEVLPELGSIQPPYAFKCGWLIRGFRAALRLEAHRETYAKPTLAPYLTGME